MSNAAQDRKLTVDEFIRGADTPLDDDTRYEMLDGDVVAQTGNVGRHVKAIKGMERALDDALPDSCTAYAGMGVSCGVDVALVPDLIVVSGREIGDDERYITDPLIIVEVLSPLTTARDMVDKPMAYRDVRSLEHYLVVHPVERFILIHSAGPKRDWSIVRVAREDFALDPTGATIPFDTIFARLSG